jgi:hypothetical protein
LRCGRTRMRLRTQPHTAAHGCVSVKASARANARVRLSARCVVYARAPVGVGEGACVQSVTTSWSSPSAMCTWNVSLNSIVHPGTPLLGICTVCFAARAAPSNVQTGYGGTIMLVTNDCLPHVMTQNFGSPLPLFDSDRTVCTQCAALLEVYNGDSRASHGHAGAWRPAAPPPLRAA